MSRDCLSVLFLAYVQLPPGCDNLLTSLVLHRPHTNLRPRVGAPDALRVHRTEDIGQCMHAHQDEG
jgi:hypothetical protein